MTVEFTIEGLDAKQRVLADIIWSLPTKDKVDAFIQSLPPETARDARSVVNLMIMAAVEQCYDGLGSMDEAQALINKARRG